MTQLIEKRDYEMLADIYMQQGQEDLVNHNELEAIEKMEKSLKLLRRAKSIEKYIKNLNILGVVYAQLKNEDKAFECYLEALANAEVIRCSYLIALCYINVGSCYQQMDRHHDAILYYKEAEEMLKNPDVKKQDKYAMWTMVNYLNLRDAYGDARQTNYPDFSFKDQSLVFI